MKTRIPNFLLLLPALLLLGATTAEAADDVRPPRPDSHAPIGVMGEHVHSKGEWMASYRYMRMNMEPNRIGTDDVSARSQLVVGGGTWSKQPPCSSTGSRPDGRSRSTDR